jgi:hypothetical protein
MREKKGVKLVKAWRAFTPSPAAPRSRVAFNSANCRHGDTWSEVVAVATVLFTRVNPYHISLCFFSFL